MATRNLKRNLKWFIRIIIAYMIVNIIYVVIPRGVKIFFHLETRDQIDTTFITHQIPNDYSKILKLTQNSRADSEFVLKETVMSKFRNPISSLIYRDKYYLQIYKLTDRFIGSLANSVEEQFVRSSASYNTYYSVIANNNIQYMYMAYLPKKPKKIILSLYGKNTRKIIQNDTMLDYYADVRNFSVRYDQEKSLDICGSSKEGLFKAKYEPFEIMFFKDNNSSLYLFMMSIYGKNTHYSPGILYDLIKSNR